MSPRRIAIYPGSFDPLTMGHVDIIARGSALFDAIIVGVLRNVDKQPLFTVDERLDMIRETFQDRENVEPDSFTGLLVDYAKSRNATTIVRGIRAISDFEYEFQMALMNRRLAPDIETVFMMPAEEYSYVSSRLVKEVASLGGDIAGLVPKGVEARLLEKLPTSGMSRKK
jgi:pantetheine-phosphate adenylyltransferase